MDPTNPSVLYAGGYGVFRTFDGASTWRLTQLGGTIIDAIAVAPSDPSIIYAGLPCCYGPSDVFLSTDRGDTWSSAGLPTSWIQGLAVDPTDPNTVYVGEDAGVDKTTNGGVSWTLLPGSPKHTGTVAVDPIDPNRIYAVARAGNLIFFSTDGGATWKGFYAGNQSSVLKNWPIAFDRRTPQTVYVGNHHGLYMSTDSMTWNPTGITKGDVKAIAAAPDGSRIYAVTQPPAGGWGIA